jgi:hypothetical protein
MDQVPSPITGLEYFPPAMKELMFPLLQQIFLPSTSAKVTGVAIADDNKIEARAEPTASDTSGFEIMSASLDLGTPTFAPAHASKADRQEECPRMPQMEPDLT